METYKQGSREYQNYLVAYKALEWDLDQMDTLLMQPALGRGPSVGPAEG